MHAHKSKQSKAFMRKHFCIKDYPNILKFSTVSSDITVSSIYSPAQDIFTNPPNPPPPSCLPPHHESSVDSTAPEVGRVFGQVHRAQPLHHTVVGPLGDLCRTDVALETARDSILPQCCHHNHCYQWYGLIPRVWSLKGSHMYGVNL